MDSICIDLSKHETPEPTGHFFTNQNLGRMCWVTFHRIRSGQNGHEYAGNVTIEFESPEELIEFSTRLSAQAEKLIAQRPKKPVYAHDVLEGVRA